MDGFAVRAADVPGRCRSCSGSRPGRPAERPLEAGEAMEISTGGAVPDGADAVVPIERRCRKRQQHRDRGAGRAGAHVRPIGGDVRAGEPLLAAGTVLGAAQIGALAAAGVAEVACARRPAVVVLSTGTELRAPGEALGPGQIYESNGADARRGASRPRARSSSGSGRSPTTRTRTARALERGPRGRRARQLRRRLGRAARPRAPDPRPSSASRRTSGASPSGPGKPLAFGDARRDARLRAAGQPGLGARRRSSCSSGPRCWRSRGRRARARTTSGARLGVAAATERRARRARRGRARAREGDETVLEPVTGQESHMIARAAAADALVHVPRRRG